MIDIDGRGMPDYPEKSYSIDDDIINIVSTPGILDGAPRIDGHKIAVYRILALYRAGYSVAEIAGDEIFSCLSEAHVRAALHYAADHGAAVERSSKPRDTPLHIDVSFDSKQGGPRLAVFDIERDKPGAIEEVALGIDDLPNRYTVQDLYAAWSWMFEKSNPPDWPDSSEDNSRV